MGEVTCSEPLKHRAHPHAWSHTLLQVMKPSTSLGYEQAQPLKPSNRGGKCCREVGSIPGKSTGSSRGQTGGDRGSRGRHRVHIPILMDTLPPCCAHRRPALLLGAEVLVVWWM